VGADGGAAGGRRPGRARRGVDQRPAAVAARDEHGDAQPPLHARVAVPARAPRGLDRLRHEPGGLARAAGRALRGHLRAWLTWRFESARLADAQSTIISDTVRPGSWQNPVLRRRVIGGAVIMALAGGGAVAAQPLLDPPAGTIRYAARDHINPPFDPREYVSPLSEFRGYLKDQRDAELFTVSGMSSGEYVRLATMDQWDQHVYNVASSTDKGSA